jgi:serine-type D-Ala-D-Ala carboxypeptidase
VCHHRPVSLTRRAALGAGIAALAGCAEPAAPAWKEPAAEPVTPEHSAATAAAPYAGQVQGVLTRYLKPTPDNLAHPGYAGAVALVQVGGRTTLHTAVGHALRYRAGPVELPIGRRVAMRPDSIFDLASLTKVYTALLVLHLAGQGAIDLDAPLQRNLPDFAGAGKAPVTAAMLLAHTSALPTGARVTGLPDNAARWRAVLATPLVRGGVPGTTFRYSSVGLMVLGRLVEKLTGLGLDRALRDNLLTPLGLKDTGFRPLTWVGDQERLVATDARSSRGLLRGTVHDDVCDHLGGVAGHAGIFSTAADVAVIGRLLLNQGIHQGERLIPADLLKRAVTNVNRGKPAVDAERPGRSADHGLGFEVNQPWFMGRLATPTTYGHTGFTGTSLLVSPARDTVVVLLTNRAHPNWSWSDPDRHRVAVHDAVAG